MNKEIKLNCRYFPNHSGVRLPIKLSQRGGILSSLMREVRGNGAKQALAILVVVTFEVIRLNSSLPPYP